jgi:hypothetical protein
MADPTPQTDATTPPQPAERPRYLVTVQPGAQVKGLGFVKAGDFFTAPADDYEPSRTFIAMNKAAQRKLRELREKLKAHYECRGTVESTTARLEAAKRAHDEADAARARVLAGREKELERLAAAQKDVEELNAEVLATDPGDVKRLSKLGGERIAKMAVAEILEKTRLPTAEAAVEKAGADAEAADREVALAEAAHADARLRADAASATTFVLSSWAEIRQRLLQHDALYIEARRAALAVGAGEPLATYWSGVAGGLRGDSYRGSAPLQVLLREVGRALESIEGDQRERESQGEQVRQAQQHWLDHRELVGEHKPGVFTVTPAAGPAPSSNESAGRRVADDGGPAQSGASRIVNPEEA